MNQGEAATLAASMFGSSKLDAWQILLKMFVSALKSLLWRREGLGLLLVLIERWYRRRRRDKAAQSAIRGTGYALDRTYCEKNALSFKHPVLLRCLMLIIVVLEAELAAPRKLRHSAR